MKLGQFVAFDSRKAREAAVPSGAAPEDVVPDDVAGELSGDTPAGEDADPEGAADSETRNPISD